MLIDHAGRSGSQDVGRYFFAVGVFGFALAAPAGIAIPRLNPPLPPFEFFKQCKPVPHIEGFELVVSCNPGNDANSTMGKAVDGDSQKRHFSYILYKYTTSSDDPEMPARATLYSVYQFAWDCRLKGAIKREVFARVDIPDLPSSTVRVDLANWKQDDKINLDYLRQSCPPRAGFIRIGNQEVGIKSAIRAGSRANVRVIFNDGSEGTYVVDCQSMMLGFNKAPNMPVKPGSVGHEIYKSVCG